MNYVVDEYDFHDVSRVRLSFEGVSVESKDKYDSITIQ